MTVNKIDVNAVNTRTEAAQLLGSLGGRVKSEAKKKAGIENLKKAREKLFIQRTTQLTNKG